MTDVELEQLAALNKCSFSPGSSAKSFVRRLASYADVDAKELTDPAIRDSADVRKFTSARELSEKETAFLDNLAHQYRKQIGRCMSVACMGCLPSAPKDPETIKVAIDALIEGLDGCANARAVFTKEYAPHVPNWLRAARALYNQRNGSKFAHLHEYATSCAPQSRRADTRGDVFCRLCGERLLAQVKQPHKLVAESADATRHLTICALQFLSGMREPAKPGHRTVPMENLWGDDAPLFAHAGQGKT